MCLNELADDLACRSEILKKKEKDKELMANVFVLCGLEWIMTANLGAVNKKALAHLFLFCWNTS